MGGADSAPVPTDPLAALEHGPEVTDVDLSGADAEAYEEIRYEGFGPGGVGIIVEALTDNRNRAAMEVRTVVTRNGGTMADPGSVSRLFHRKGVVLVPMEQEGREVSEDDVLEASLEAGVEDVNDLGDSFEVLSEATDVVEVRTALQAAGIDYDSAEASFQPSVSVPVDAEGARKVFKLIDALEDNDDVDIEVDDVDVDLFP